MSFSLFMMRVWSAPRAPRRLGELARLINPVPPATLCVALRAGALRPNLGAARWPRESRSTCQRGHVIGLRALTRRHAWMTMLPVAVATALRPPR
jgi:hypothetical protein